MGGVLQFILGCALIVFLDRVFPWTVIRAAPQLWEGSMKDVMKRYGFVKFPRTALAALACVAGGLEWLTGLGRLTGGWLYPCFGLVFLAGAAVDTFRARKPGPGERPQD